MSLSEPVVPDYGGASIANLIPALLQPRGERPGWLPEAVQSAQQVVLLVADGLGWLQLQDRTHLAPRLASMSGGPITSVAPTTTACALTSLVVGGRPSDHGVVGYRVVVPGPSGDEVMNVLKWRTSAGDARSFVDPAKFQSMTPFLGHPIPVVSKAEFAGTAFTEAHQRGARQVGWFQASGLAVEVGDLLTAGESLVYAYYDGVDKIAHIRGFGPHYDAELTALDRLVGDLIDLLPPGAVLLVTADHGQVDVGRRAVAIDPRVLADVTLVSGEARFRWLHAKDTTARGVEKLAVLATEIYGHEAWVSTYDQVERDGWLGGPMRPEVRARVGDVAIVPFEPVAYLDEAEVGESRLLCRHGSLTAAEMLVPLVAHRGRLEP
jgi:hypothetical protein